MEGLKESRCIPEGCLWGPENRVRGSSVEREARRQELVRRMVRISAAKLSVKLDISSHCTLDPHHPQKWSWQLPGCPLGFLAERGGLQSS